MKILDYLFARTTKVDKAVSTPQNIVRQPILPSGVDSYSNRDSVYASRLAYIENLLYRSVYAYQAENSPTSNADDTGKYITQGYATNADLFSVIELILTECGALDWVLEEKVGNRWQKVEEHEILEYWSSPNPFQTSTEFVHDAIGYELLTGNSYIYSPKLSSPWSKGKGTELHIMPSPLVRIQFGTSLNPYGGYTIEYTPTIHEKIAPEDVIHIKSWNPIPDEQRSLYGMSPLKALLRTIRRSNSSDFTQTKLIENYGPPSIIGPDYAGLDPERIVPLDDTQLEDMKDRFIEKTGPANAGVPLFAAMPWKLQQFGLSSADLKLLESGEADLKKMCNAFGVPFRLLNDGAGGTYNNMEQDMKRVYTRSVLPRMYRLAEKLTRRWVQPGWTEKYRLRIDSSNIEVLQKNMKDTALWLNQAWWMKGTQKQEAMGLEPDPEMDLYFIPNNLTPFTSLDEAIAQQQEGIDTGEQSGTEEIDDTE